MTTVTPTTLNVLAPCELEQGDRIIGWVEDIDLPISERTLIELSWDDTYDREWTVVSTATGSYHEVRVNFTDDTDITFDPGALILVTRGVVTGRRGRL